MKKRNDSEAAPGLSAPTVLLLVVALLAVEAGMGCSGPSGAGGDTADEAAAEEVPPVRVLANAVRASAWDDPAGTIEVPADSAAGFSWPYLLYAPASSGEDDGGTALTILVWTNNTGGVSDEFGEHAAAAARHFPRCRARARAIGCACLMPVFPRSRSGWRTYTHALDRDCLTTKEPGIERLDRQLLAMIDDASARLARTGRPVDGKVILGGFSASAMFANRFALLHPERVRAAAIGSPGGWPIAPVATWRDRRLRYPVGIDDLERLVGRRFDGDRFREIAFFFFLGAEDGNDSVTFDDGYDDADEAVILELFGPDPVKRWDSARTLYAAADANADFRLYKRAGHRISRAMERDMRRFFRLALANK